jgi:antitoxin VapB
VALRITNPVVVANVKLLARAMGLTKTAVVERAIDRLAAETQVGADPRRLTKLLEQLDKIPNRQDAFDPLEWDAPAPPEMIVVDTLGIGAIRDERA